jgi:iron complex transport system substrate-binding protein
VRIVSLLPSATEILFAVGAGDSVVGVTFECDFPPEARSRRVVANTTLPEGLSPRQIDAEVRARVDAGEDIYRLDAGALADLAPEIVITQDLCAVCAVDVANVEAALDHLGCRARVVTLDPMTLDGVWDSILEVGEVTGRTDEADELVERLRRRLAALTAAVAGRPRPRMAVLEWADPPYSSGHWVPDMVTAAGATPVLGAAGERSRRINWPDVTAAAPDLVVVAPCGYRLADAAGMAADLVAAAVLPPGTPVWAVDANAVFVRPGPRLVDGIEALAALAHPGAVPARDDLAVRVPDSSPPAGSGGPRTETLQ